MIACTSPRTSASDTRSTAVSPPNRREMFDAARTIASSSMRNRRAQAAQLAGQAGDAVRHQRNAANDRQTQRQLPMARKAAKQRFGLEQFLQHDEHERAEH